MTGIRGTIEEIAFKPGELEAIRVQKLALVLAELLLARGVTTDDVIEALAALTPAADEMIYFTSPTAAAMTPLTAFARTLLDDADATAAQSTIGYTPADALAKIKTVDGAASGLDSDLLDGQHGLFYTLRSNHSGTQTAATISDFDAAADARIAAAVGVSVQAFDATLSAFAAYNTNGILVQTAADTFAGRTLTAPAAGITVSNGNGVAGNPTLALADDLAALEALSGTNTIYYRSAANTWTAVTIGGMLSFSSGTLNIGDAELSAIAGLTSAADRLPYFNGSGTAALATFTASGRTVVAASGVTGTGSVVFSANPAFTGTSTFSKSGQALAVDNTGSGGYNIELKRDGAIRGYIGQNASGPALFDSAATERVTVSTTGMDVTGESRCDTLRIDGSLTADAGAASTHTFPVSIGGTIKNVLCK